MRLRLAELRGSWTAWLGVSVVFIVINFALVLSAMAVAAGARVVMSGRVSIMDSAAYIASPALNVLFCAAVGAAVIDAATALVVDSRRGALARLSLAGATPGQVVGTVMVQLVAVTLATSVVGAGLAFAVLPAALRFMAYERSEQANLPVPQIVWSPWAICGAIALTTALALLGGLRQARRASRFEPVEALRQSQGDGERRMGAGRWVLAALCTVVIVLSWVFLPAIVGANHHEAVSNTFQISLALLVLVGVVIAALAPRIVGPITRGWSRLVPTASASWVLARHSSAARGARLAKSVVPVMLTVGLLVGGLALSDAVQQTARANGWPAMSAAGFATSFLFLALPLLIALSGSVGSLIMMARQRDAELALFGVAGATPRQRVWMPVLEGVIITVTGTLLGLVMSVVAVAYLLVGVHLSGLAHALPVNLGVFAGAVGVSLVVNVAATTLPTLPALRRPEPVVVARLVAE